MSTRSDDSTDSRSSDARDAAAAMLRSKQERITSEVEEHRRRSLAERVERVRAASALGLRLFALNPNRERVLAARERENEAFAALCREIAAREQS